MAKPTSGSDPQQPADGPRPWRDPYTEDIQPHLPQRQDLAPRDPAPSPRLVRARATAEAARREREREWAANRPTIFSDVSALRAFLDGAIAARRKRQAAGELLEEEFEFYFSGRQSESVCSIDALRAALELVDAWWPALDRARAVLAAWTLADQQHKELDRVGAVIFYNAKLPWRMLRGFDPMQVWFGKEFYELLSHQAELTRLVAAMWTMYGVGKFFNEEGGPAWAGKISERIEAFLSETGQLVRGCLADVEARIAGAKEGTRELRAASDERPTAGVDEERRLKRFAVVGDHCYRVATEINRKYPAKQRTRSYERTYAGRVSQSTRETPGLYRKEVLEPTAEIVSAMTGIYLAPADVKARLQKRASANE